MQRERQQKKPKAKHGGVRVNDGSPGCPLGAEDTVADSAQPSRSQSVRDFLMVAGLP
jgi:hypothetical protein